METSPGNYSLLLNAGFDRAVDAAAEAHGHEPGGYFWAGVARALMERDAPDLGEALSFDPEGSMFCAYGADREALVRLAELMRPAVTDVAALEEVLVDLEPTSG